MNLPPGETVFAQMVVPAPSLQKALPVLSAAWWEHCYQFVDVLGAVRFNMDNWNFEKHPEGSVERMLCVEAVKTGQAKYGAVITSGS